MRNTTPTKTYSVRVTRSKDWWIAEVPELDRVYTQAKSISQVKSLVREVINLVHDIDPETFDLEIEVAAQDIIGDQFETYLSVREQHMKATTEIEELRRLVAVKLVNEQGLTQADAGAIMKLSPQRVSQILADA